MVQALLRKRGITGAGATVHAACDTKRAASRQERVPRCYARRNQS
jgi:hypothetical protein